VNNITTEGSDAEVNQNNSKMHPTKLAEGNNEGSGLRSNGAKDTKPQIVSSLAEEKSGGTGTKVDEKDGAGEKGDKEMWKHDEEKLADPGRDVDIDEGDIFSSKEEKDGFSDSIETTS
jgi:hypothetical protein